LEVFARGTNELEIGDSSRFLANIRIALRSGSVHLGARCLVRDGVWLKADGAFETGPGVTLGPFGAIHCTNSIVFDELVGLGERVSVIDSDHTFDGTDVHYMEKPLTVTPIRLGRQTMVAMGSVILRGVTTGPNSVVAANSVVRDGSYPRAALIAGNPARVIRTLSPTSEHEDAVPDASPEHGDDFDRVFSEEEQA
jgi:acetyltransferase-like isoleucine patch superfamily enzyme